MVRPNVEKTRPSERRNEADTARSWHLRRLPRPPGFLELDTRRATPFWLSADRPLVSCSLFAVCVGIDVAARKIRLAEITGGHREQTAGERHAMIPGIIVLVYLAVVLSIGILASRRGKPSGEDYFVASRSLEPIRVSSRAVRDEHDRVCDSRQLGHGVSSGHRRLRLDGVIICVGDPAHALFHRHATLGNWEKVRPYDAGAVFSRSLGMRRDRDGDFRDSRS